MVLIVRWCGDVRMATWWIQADYLIANGSMSVKAQMLCDVPRGNAAKRVVQLQKSVAGKTKWLCHRQQANVELALPDWMTSKAKWSGWL